VTSGDEEIRAEVRDGKAPAEAAGPIAAKVLVARQAIYDASQNVVAYELLYRRCSDSTAADVIDGRQATLQVITNAVLEIGLDQLAGDVPVHINYPQELLVECAALPVPPQRVVIEVLESVRGDTAVLKGISAMRTRGHRIALDDFSLQASDPALLDVADIVKLDISQHSGPELESLLAALKRRGFSLVAERVETADDFKRCLALGFDAFQGYFLQHPRIFSARPVPASRLGTLRLIAILQSDDSSINDIERLISLDTSLSYRVLRCINSSYYNFTRKIDSIRQAVVILGFEKLRQLCALIALQDLEDRPPSILIDAMTRARMCEQLGALRGFRATPALFITGLFSMLDVLTGIPMPELLQGLPLSPPVIEALISQEGELGGVLREVLAFERGTWSTRNYAGVSAEAIQRTYVEAVSWAEATQSAMVAG
jgi:EAL and modified HD-GYP domain-containing signal transduction protein